MEKAAEISEFERELRKTKNQAELEIIVRHEKQRISDAYKIAYDKMMTDYENALIEVNETRIKKDTDIIKKKNQLINELEALGDSEADKKRNIKIGSEIRDAKTKLAKVNDVFILGKQKISVVMEQQKRKLLLQKSSEESFMRRLADKKFLEFAERISLEQIKEFAPENLAYNFDKK